MGRPFPIGKRALGGEWEGWRSGAVEEVVMESVCDTDMED